MTPRRTAAAGRRAAIAALLRADALALLRNPAACTVMIFAFVAAGVLRFGSSRGGAGGGEECYIVFWEDGPWIEHLRIAARTRNPDGLNLHIVHVNDVAGANGTIVYPPGVHSIQIRPGTTTPRGQPRWLVWYWYCGADPAALWPCSRWFWRATSEHFGRRATSGPQWDERVSALQPHAAVLGNTTRVALGTIHSPESLQTGLVWLVVFFFACHLATQHLAEARFTSVIESLAVTPVGWTGVSLAGRLSFGGCAVACAAIVLAILRPDTLLSVRAWLGIVGVAVTYSGVALVVGSWSRSPARAGIVTMIYALVAAGVTAVALAASQAVGPWTGLVSAEWCFLELIRTAWPDAGAPPASAVLGIVLWCLIWQVLGEWSYRRFKQQ